MYRKIQHTYILNPVTDMGPLIPEVQEKKNRTVLFTP